MVVKTLVLAFVRVLFGSGKDLMAVLSVIGVF